MINANEWSELLKQLLENGGMPITKEFTDGTTVAAYLNTGQRLIYGIINNEKASEGFIDGARQGYMRVTSANFDVYTIACLPDPPGSNSSKEEWINYYYECKSKGLKIKWSFVADQSGFKENQLKTAAHRLRNIQRN